MTKLNTILAGLVAAIGFTAAASAQEATLLDTSNFQSTKSRAEVRAEAVGVAHSGEVTYFNDVVAGNGLSRAQVQAEAREALRLGVLPRGEYTPSRPRRSSSRSASPDCARSPKLRWPAPTDRARCARASAASLGPAAQRAVARSTASAQWRHRRRKARVTDLDPSSN